MGFAIYYSLINGKINVQNKGNGTDTIRFDGCSISDDVYLEMGNGPIQTSGLFSTFQGNFSWLAGSGSFTTTFGDCGFYKSVFQNFFEGATDTKFYFVSVRGLADIQNGLGFDQTLLANLSVGILNIRNGDGGSKVSTRSQDSNPNSLNISLLNITNGEGTDTFTTKGPNASSRAGHLGSLEINNGIGNSLAEVTDSRVTIEHVHVVAGTGFDTLTFGDTEIGDIVADLNDGGSQTTFDQTSIDGHFDFYGGAGDDQIILAGTATYGGPVYIDLAGGTDFINIVPHGHNPFFGPLVIDGGAGYDAISNAPFPESFPNYLEITNFEFGI